jgi:deoxyadenosine/deoxycytidine kinase
MQTKKKYIAICGGMAVGKTTLGKFLAERSSQISFDIENVGENPYLADFYIDMQKWGFHSRIAFLAMKAYAYEHHNGLNNIIVLDRCFHELITFAELSYELGNISERDFETYVKLYTSLVNRLPKVDLILYCYCSPKIASERLKIRGREFEQNVKIEYLHRIDEKYQAWIGKQQANGIKVIYINTELPIDYDDVLSMVLR